MSNYTHETIPTKFVEDEGIRYAYRRVGKTGTSPLLYFDSSHGAQHQHEEIFLEHLKLFFNDRGSLISHPNAINSPVALSR